MTRLKSCRIMWILALAGTLAPAGGLAAFAWWAAGHSMQARYDRIRPGATRADVRALMGAEPSSSFSFNARAVPSPWAHGLRNATRCEYWDDDVLLINVYYDQNNQVVDKAAAVVNARSFFDRLRSRMGLHRRTTGE